MLLLLHEGVEHLIVSHLQGKAVHGKLGRGFLCLFAPCDGLRYLQVLLCLPGDGGDE